MSRRCNRRGALQVLNRRRLRFAALARVLCPHPHCDNQLSAGGRPVVSAPQLVAVLDMGASAIRLIIAEIGADRSIRTIEEASRGILLGRDTFSSGAIRSKTIDATLAALGNFRHLIDGYGVQETRAVATSAVREARNVDIFLDRIRGRTGIEFDIINEAEESR